MADSSAFNLVRPVTAVVSGTIGEGIEIEQEYCDIAIGRLGLRSKSEQIVGFNL